MNRSHAGVIAVPLRSPVYFHISATTRRLCLDAVLAGIHYGQNGDGPAAIEWSRKVIDQWDAGEGIPKASQAIFTGVRSVSTEIIARSFIRHVDDPAVRERTAGVRWDNKPSTMERPYKSGMVNSYIAIDAPMIVYMVTGDLDQIETMLRQAGRIGALRAKGGGEIDVSQIRIDEVPSAGPLFGVVCGGKLLRPIPMTLEADLNRHGEVDYRNGIVENWRSPFNDESTREMCLVPVQSAPHMSLEFNQVVKLVR